MTEDTPRWLELWRLRKTGEMPIRGRPPIPVKREVRDPRARAFNEAAITIEKALRAGVTPYQLLCEVHDSLEELHYSAPATEQKRQAQVASLGQCRKAYRDAMVRAGQNI